MKTVFSVTVLLALAAAAWFWWTKTERPAPEYIFSTLQEMQEETPFAVFALRDLPESYILEEASIGSAIDPATNLRVAGATYQKKDHSIQLRMYAFQDVLSYYGETEEEFFRDTRTKLERGGKTVYLSPSDVLTIAGKEKYAVAAALVAGGTYVRVEYLGKEEISDERLAEIAASLTPVEVSE